jgi:hypothetical protein
MGGVLNAFILAPTKLLNDLNPAHGLALREEPPHRGIVEIGVERLHAAIAGHFEQNVVVGHPFVELGPAVPLDPRKAIIFRHEGFLEYLHVSHAMYRRHLGEMVRFVAQDFECLIEAKRCCSVLRWTISQSSSLDKNSVVSGAVPATAHHDNFHLALGCRLW